MVSVWQLRSEPSTVDTLAALSVYDALSLKRPFRLLYPVITIKNIGYVGGILPVFLS